MSAVLLLSIVLGGCGATPTDSPAAEPVDSGPAAVLDEARTVAHDLEQRQVEIDARIRDPFARP